MKNKIFKLVLFMLKENLQVPTELFLENQTPEALGQPVALSLMDLAQMGCPLPGVLAQMSSVYHQTVDGQSEFAPKFPQLITKLGTPTEPAQKIDEAWNKYEAAVKNGQDGPIRMTGGNLRVALDRSGVSGLQVVFIPSQQGKMAEQPGHKVGRDSSYGLFRRIVNSKPARWLTAAAIAVAAGAPLSAHANQGYDVHSGRCPPGTEFQKANTDQGFWCVEITNSPPTQQYQAPVQPSAPDQSWSYETAPTHQAPAQPSTPAPEGDCKCNWLGCFRDVDVDSIWTIHSVECIPPGGVAPSRSYETAPTQRYQAPAQEYSGWVKVPIGQNIPWYCYPGIPAAQIAGGLIGAPTGLGGMLTGAAVAGGVVLVWCETR